jgi:CBS-domain-containing membrane protein/PII-like signaling protein
MITRKNAILLRIFMGELDKHGGRPMFEAVVAAARAAGLLGATAQRGILGYGADSLVHTAKILRLAEDLPVIVEIIDESVRIETFLPMLDEMLPGGAYALIPVEAVFNRTPRVADVMTKHPLTVPPETPISEVVELLIRQNVKAVPVTKDGKILGVVTGGDLVSKGGLPLRLSLAPLLPSHVRDSHKLILGQTGLNAGDVMSAPARTVRASMPLPEVARRMVKYVVKRFPVVDDAGKLVGIVSRADILRSLAGSSTHAAPSPEMARTLALAAKDAMITDVPTAAPDTPLPVVIESLLTSPLERVVVVDQDNRVVGIILDSDLLATFSQTDQNTGFLKTLLKAFAKKPQVPVHAPGVAADVMRSEVYTVNENDPLLHVMRAITKTHAKRLTVTSGDGKLVGMIDRERLLRALGRDENEAEGKK